MNSNSEITITVPENIDVLELTGPGDEYIRAIRAAFDARITLRGHEIAITGSEHECQALATVFTDLIGRLTSGQKIATEDVTRALALVKTGEFAPKALHDDVVLTYRGKAIHPKTPNQKAYVDAIRNNTITFGIGPAGTGKTYLAMAMAVAAFNRKEITRITLTRPVVEAGESLGFLPGTFNEKIDPYIRPLYDALFEMMEPAKATKLIDEGVIEIAPLAFMRGRTLHNSYIILDEAQNTTSRQMKMFLTRLGFGSKMIITGDITQTDLPPGQSGLKSVQTILGHLDDIAFCEFSSKDVVRHSLVAKIVSAYAKAEEIQG